MRYARSPIVVVGFAEANRIHGESAAVKKFASILYPNCLAPVEFVEYTQLDANAAFGRL